jgi:hypothetical protein
VPRQTGKGRHRRQAAFEKRVTQHHDFIGEGEQDRQAVREMARELEEMAGVRGDGAIGPEFPIRLPRSIEEGKRMVREVPDALREKARERLEELPEGVRKAIGIATDVAGLLFAPLRVGLALARELSRVPLAMLHVLRHKEA